MQHNIVLIDDNFAIRQIIKVFLARLSRKYTFDLKIFSSDNGVEGLGFVFITDPNIIIVDTTLPKYSGKNIVEFFVQNRKFRSKEITVIVLEERTDRTLNLPKNFIRINKNHPKAFDKLTDVLVEKLNISDFGRMSKFYDYIGGKVMNFSNKDDLLEKKLEGKFKLSNILYRFKWAIQEIFISTSLSLIMLFFGKAKDDNITQSKLDNKIFRTKYYPTLALSFVSALFILINITLFTFSQFSLFQNLNKELQAAITDPPTYLVNLPNTNFSAGGYYAQFSRPRGIAVDSVGDIYIVDTKLYRIQKFNADGTKETEWGSYGSGNGQFNSAVEIAVDSSDNVYVTDGLNNRVQKFSSTGTYITQWGTLGTGNGQFDLPDGIEINSSDVIYVADKDNNRIQYFNTSGVYLGKWGTSGTGNGQLNGPTGISMDSTGNVYVAEEFNDRIQKFTSTGTYITKWGSYGSGNGQFNDPQGIGINSSDVVYVMDTYNNRVQVFDTNGNYTTQWGTYGFADGQFNLPYGVDFDSLGNIYISENMNHRIQKFNSSAVYQTKWWGSSGNQDGQYRGPRGIGISSTGNTYVADAGDRRIQKFDVSGVHSISWGDFGTGNGEFYEPSGVAVDSLGNVYTTETNNNRVQKFDSNGNYVNQWGTYGSGNGQFNTPYGIAIDASDNIYVADSYNHRIQIFNTSGTYINKFGSAGTGNGQFYYPYALTVDSLGNIYVSDTSNHRIQKFNSSYTYVSQWGTNGSGDGQFAYPYGITVSGDGHVYVADNGNNRIQKFDQDGQFLVSFGGFGTENGEFYAPFGISVYQDSLYVSDSSNRVQIFDISDVVPSPTLAPTFTPSPTVNTTPLPTPYAPSNLNPSGDMYIYDTSPTLYFELHAPNPATSLSYNLIITQDMLIISDYTSMPGPQGLRSFKIGQSDGPENGTYNGAGFYGQTLDMGGYNWSVQAIESPGITSEIISAIGDNFAFMVDLSTPEPTPTDIPLPSETITITETPAPSATNTPLPTATNTPVPTPTNTPLPTATNTPLPTPTNTPLPTPTVTPLPTPTDSPTPTATPTPTLAPPNAPTDLGPAMLEGGGYTSDTTPTLEFTTSATDTGMPLSYRIQILLGAAIVVDYTSEETVQGIKYFTVGQAAGLGTYNNGDGIEGQTLIEGEYSWKVMATGSSGSSAWSDANNGNVAFTVDLQTPNGGSISYTNGYHTTASVPLVVDDGTDSGGINTSTRLIERSSATLTSNVCSSFGTFETVTPTGTYPNLTDNSVTQANCYQYRYTVSDNAGNEATYTSANIAKIDIDAASAPGIPQTETPTTSVIQQWVWDAGVDTVSGIAQYVWRVVDEFDNTVDSGVSTTLDTTTNLGVGVYTFFVSALNNAGLISDESFFNITVEPTPTSTPVPSATPLPTDTPLPTATDTPIPTPTDTPLPTATNAPLPTPTNTALPTATNTPIPTATNTPLPTVTNTPIPTPTSTSMPTPISAPVFVPTFTPTAGAILPSPTVEEVLDTIAPTDLIITQEPTSTPVIRLDSPTPEVIETDSNDGGFFSDFSPKNTYAMPEESVVNHPVVKSVAKSITQRLEQLSSESSPLLPIVETPLIVAEAIKPITDNFNYYLSLRFIGENTALAGISTTNVLAYMAPAIVTAASQPRILFHALTWFWKRKSKQPWGIVFDKNTGAPVAFARMILTQDGKTISTQTTDLQGKYGFSANKGKYQVFISHSDYLDFVSDIEVGYDGEIISKDFEVSAKTRDDVNSSLRWTFYKLKKQISNNLFVLNTTIFSIGFVYTLFAITNHLTLLNYVILSLYLFQFVLMFVFYLFKDKESGQVTDIASGLPVPGAIVRIFDEERQIDIAITDSQGRYSFILEPGSYFIKASANGYVFPSDDTPNIVKDKLGGKLLKFTIQDKQRVNIKIYMRKFASLNANNQAILSPFS